MSIKPEKPSRCPQGGCSRGKIHNVFLESGGGFGTIWCEEWRDISYHPVSGGRECPFELDKRPVPHWWVGKDDGEPFPGWVE